jgi:hypothetical protein
VSKKFWGIDVKEINEEDENKLSKKNTFKGLLEILTDLYEEELIRFL